MKNTNAVVNTFRKINQYFIGEDTQDITVSDYAWFYGTYIMAVLIIALTIFGGGGNADASGVASEGNTNVGDGETYSYIITYITNGDFGKEYHGVPVTKASEGNQGILLYASEVSFDVEYGDFIDVIWGEEEDEFASITRTEAWRCLR